MQATFAFDFDNEYELRELRDLLNWKLNRMESGDNEDINGNPTGVQLNNLEILNKFLVEASDKQLTVLKWMKDHPGNVSAHILKEELPFLAPTGTISGVFRPGRWQRLTGGTKDGFPFVQVDWNHEKGCGIYRGLTEEEAANLDI